MLFIIPYLQEEVRQRVSYLPSYREMNLGFLLKSHTSIKLYSWIISESGPA